MLPPNPERRTAGLDLLGITTLSTSLLLVVVPLILGRAQRWPTWTWLCLAASLPAFALFWRGQQRTAGGGNPLIKTEVVGRARVILGLLAPADRHRDLHRAAVHPRPVLPAGPRAQRAGLRTRPGALGRRIRSGRAGHPPPTHPPRPDPAPCREPAARRGVSHHQRRRAHRPSRRRRPGGAARRRRFRARHRIRHSHRASDQRRPAGYAPDISGVATTALQIGGAIRRSRLRQPLPRPGRTPRSIRSQPRLRPDQHFSRRRRAYRRRNGIPDHARPPRRHPRTSPGYLSRERNERQTPTAPRPLPILCHRGIGDRNAIITQGTRITDASGPTTLDTAASAVAPHSYFPVKHQSGSRRGVLLDKVQRVRLPRAMPMRGQQ